MDFRSFLGNIAKSYLALGALTVSAYAGANEYNDSYYYGSQPCPQPCAPVCAPVCNAPPHCPWGYNPPAYNKCGNGATNFCDTLGFTVDFLYWRTSVQDLALGTQEHLSLGASGSGIAVDKSYVKRPEFNCDPGFRIGLSHFSPCDCYDVALNWTHYHTKSTVKGASDDFIDPITAATTVPADYTLFVPFWERANGVTPDLSKGRFVLDTDLLDLEFGHKYYVTSCFVFRPHVGLRGARINQSFHVESSANRALANIYTLGSVFNSYSSEVKARNDFLAIGPRIGFDIELDLGCGFAIVGKAAGSILFGSPRRHSSEDFYGTAAPLSSSAVLIPGDFTYRSNGTHSGYSRTVSDLAIGVQWEHCVTCCNQSYPLVLAALWEHHGFYNFNDFDFESNGYAPLYDDNISATTDLRGGYVTNPSKATAGDIFTQGLTFSVGVGF